MALNVGVVGVGKIGQEHIRRLTETLAGARVVAVSDADADRCVAEWTAWMNTFDAPGGSALVSPFTSRLTAPEPMWIRLARPSRAISAGNSARNQW